MLHVTHHTTNTVSYMVAIHYLISILTVFPSFFRENSIKHWPSRSFTGIKPTKIIILFHHHDDVNRWLGVGTLSCRRGRLNVNVCDREHSYCMLCVCNVPCVCVCVCTLSTQGRKMRNKINITEFIHTFIWFCLQFFWIWIWIIKMKGLPFS